MRRSAFAVGGIVAAAALVMSTGLARPVMADSKSWLGVYTQEISDELREGMDYNGNGALVRSVVPGSPAARAGIQRGDIIVRVGSKSIDSPTELADVVGDMPAGSVNVEIVRNDQKRPLRVTLESRDESGEDFESPAPPPMPRHGMVPPVPPAPMMRHDQDNDRHQDMDRDEDNDRHEDMDRDDQGDPQDMDRDDHGDHQDMDRDDHGDRHPDNGGDTFDFQMPDMSGMRTMMAGRGRLGVRVETLSPDLASYFGGRDTRGALVLEVTDGSPARSAGLRAGDVITRVDDRRIDSADDLIEAVRSSEGRVTIRVVRHGSSQSIDTTLRPMSRELRIRRPEGFNWNDGPGSSRTTPRSIRVHGDEPNRTLSPQERDELRKQVDELREQLRQLRQELREQQDKQ